MAEGSSAEVFTFDVGTHGKSSAAIYRAADPHMQATLILGHGAGASRTHPFMVDMAGRLARAGVDVVTFNFLYMEAERKMPDKVDLLEATWRAAIATVRARGGLPTEKLFIGGKSMGGRIATHIAAANEGLVLAGVVLLGYPLHPIGKPTVVREEILGVKNLPMLIVQGAKDDMGPASELKKFLGKKLPNAKMYVVEDADHSLEVPKRAAVDQETVLDRIAQTIATFVGKA
jgi:uncharacterized protein